MTDQTRTLIFLIRHGQSDGNREGRFRGRHDFPLDETGLRQAEEAAAALKNAPIQAVYSSPLVRAVSTAEPIARALGLGVELVPGLTNISLGSWEGVKKDEIARRFPELWHLWLTDPESLAEPGMETLQQAGRRAKKALDELVRRHAGGEFAVVSHRSVIKPMLAECLGIGRPSFWRLAVDAASISLLAHEPDRGYMLLFLNRTNHLTKTEIDWN